MRVARVIVVLNRRRDWIIDRLSKKCHPDSRPWLEEEKRAIENAIPILEAEREKRGIALMDQRLAVGDQR